MPHGLTIAGVPIIISTDVAAGKAWGIDPGAGVVPSVRRPLIGCLTTE